MPKKTAPKEKIKENPLASGKKKVDIKKEILLICSCCAVILVLFVSSLNINSFLYPKKVLGTQTEAETEKVENLKKEGEFWKNFLSQNPTYLDGWLEYAKIESELGDKTEAFFALEKAQSISPNSPKILDVVSQLK